MNSLIWLIVKKHENCSSKQKFPSYMKRMLNHKLPTLFSLLKLFNRLLFLFSLIYLVFNQLRNVCWISSWRNNKSIQSQGQYVRWITEEDWSNRQTYLKSTHDLHITDDSLFYLKQNQFQSILHQPYKTLYKKVQRRPPPPQPLPQVLGWCPLTSPYDFWSFRLLNNRLLFSFG